FYSLSLHDALPISFYFSDGAIQYFFCFVDQCNIITKLFDRFHSVCRVNNSRTFSVQFKNLLLYYLCVNGIKTGKRFVEDNKIWLMYHCSYKLYLLLHTFAEIFHFFVPPIFDL